jgi:hypothetical protein
MRFTYFTFISLVFLLAACGGVSEDRRNQPVNTPLRSENVANTNARSAEQPESGGAKSAFNGLGSESARKLCLETDTGDTDILKSQTFAINFEPFLDSCFVTTHNPELDDPPIESEIAIYKDNKRVFDFPDQFLKRSTLCWVTAVGFEDLNADNLVDIIVAGKCQAKMGDYVENAVYANTGKAFTTDDGANSEIYELDNIKAIADHVRKNPGKFFNK